MLSLRWMSVPPSFSTAVEVPTITSGTSTVISSLMVTAWKSMWMGLRLRGSSVMDCTSTGCALAPPTEISIRVLRVTLWRRRTSHSSALTWTGTEGLPPPKMTAGRMPARRSELTCLPVTVR